MNYYLQAELGNKSAIEHFTASNHSQAIIEASFKLMDLAWNNSLWADGKVILIDELGDIIEEAPARR